MGEQYRQGLVAGNAAGQQGSQQNCSKRGDPMAELRQLFLDAVQKAGPGKESGIAGGKTDNCKDVEH